MMAEYDDLTRRQSTDFGRAFLMISLQKYKPHLLELGLVLVAYSVYMLTSDLVFSDTAATAIVNMDKVVSLEATLGFFWEPGWQQWVLHRPDALVIFFNWVYIVTYWPVILAFGMVLFMVDRSAYYHYRSVMLISLVFALVVFALFPLASPFNLTTHLVNTIQEMGPSYYGSSEMAVFYNTNAAMPSLHFCWTVILGVVLVRSLRGGLKLLGFVYPVLTFFAITVTGNHFVLDAIAGGLLAGVAFGLIGVWDRRQRIKASAQASAQRRSNEPRR